MEPWPVPDIDNTFQLSKEEATRRTHGTFARVSRWRVCGVSRLSACVQWHRFVLGVY
jgi:hypothetical protein